MPPPLGPRSSPSVCRVSNAKPTSADPRHHHGVVADLAAVATVITDPGERRRILAPFVEEFNDRHEPGSQWPEASLDEWAERSPLARVSFAEAG